MFQPQFYSAPWIYNTFSQSNWYIPSRKIETEIWSMYTTSSSHDSVPLQRASAGLLNHCDEEVVYMDHLQCSWIMGMRTLCKGPLQCYQITVMRKWCVRTSTVLLNHGDEEVVWGPLQCYWIMVMRKLCEDFYSVTESWWWRSGVRTSTVLLNHGDEEVVWGPLQCDWIIVMRKCCEDL